MGLPKILEAIKHMVYADTAQTITGAKTFNAKVIFGVGFAISRNLTTNFLSLLGGTDNTNGASIVLNGADRSGNEGSFSVKARNAADGEKALVGAPDGSLTWNGNPVLDSTSGVTLDTAQTITGAKTLTKTLISQTSFAVAKSITNSYLGLSGGTSASDGAYIGLSGGTRSGPNAGKFRLIAQTDGTDAKVLEGLPSGSLTWASKEIERVNAVNATSKYIRYQSGFQIIFGTATIEKNTTETTVTLPIPFASRTSYSLAFAQTNNDEIFTYGSTSSDVTATAFTLKHAAASSARYIRWIAVGFGTPE